MRLDPGVVLSAGLLFGAVGVVSPEPAAVGVGALAALASRRLSLRLILAAVALAALSAWRAGAALHEYEARRLAARDGIGEPRRCAGTGRVIASPMERGGALGFSVAVPALDCEGVRLEAAVVRLYGGPPDLARGDRIDVIAKLAPVRAFRNFGLADPGPFLARRRAVLSGGTLSVTVVGRAFSLPGAIDRFRARVRARIHATFSGPADPMARALVLGENDLSDGDDAAFRRSGLSHLLAVSGTHLVFAVVALVRALGFLLTRFEMLTARGEPRRIAAAFGAVLALLYADFAGGSGSAWRAAWMLAAAFGLQALGRRPPVARTFAASIVVGAVVDPLSAFDLSFLLSLAATAGLVALGRPMAARVTARSGALRFFATAVIATVSSMVPCAPLLALLGPRITIAGIGANVVAGPFGEVAALPLCLAHSVSAAWPALEDGIASVASGALLVVRQLALLSASATWLAVPIPLPRDWQILALAVGGAGTLVTRSLRARWTWAGATGVALLLLEGAARQQGAPRRALVVTATDVGQGDSIWVDLPDGELMVVDGGGFVGTSLDLAERIHGPLLRARRRSHIDVAVLSHPHPDHYLGLAALLDTVPVGELWDTGQGRREGAGPEYHAMLRALEERGVPVLGPEELCDSERHFGAARVRVLAPCPDFSPGVDPNDNSFVLQIIFGSRRALLTGDAERRAEATLVERYGDSLRSDLLKVGHHGSRTSTTPELVERVRPAVAMISAGVRNRFGHPRQETLRTLSRAGAQTLRTDRAGAIRWWTDGERVTVRTFETPR